MMKKTPFIAVLIAIIASSAYLALAGRKPARESRKIVVAASFYTIAHFAQKAGGDLVETVSLTPAGVEPHEFEPSPRDLRSIERAKVFAYNGAGLDPWAKKIAPSLEKKGVSVVEMTHGLALLTSHGEHENGEIRDPHIWLDPLLAKAEVEKIRDALRGADPANAPAYGNNAAIYMGQLDELDRDYEDGLSSCRVRDIIVSHNAFSYLGKRYRINIIPVVGVFSGEEPSPRHMAELTRLAKEKGIRYIFTEPLESPKIARTIAGEAGIGTLPLNPIEGLTPDERKRGEDYISMMRVNLSNLRKAMDCR